jgi:hypothetical protein
VRIARAEAFLGYELPGSVKKFMELMVGIENSDPNFICLNMKPHYSEGAHDREGALKIDGLVLENIGFGRAAVEKHSFD